MKLFLSHSNQDSRWVEAVRTQLENVGITVYLAELDPQPGQPLDRKLQQQIDSSSALIALLTETSAVSPIVREEIGYALRAGKLVVPLVDPVVAKSPALLGMLNGREYIPFDIDEPEQGLVLLTNWAQNAVMLEQQEIMRQQLQQARKLAIQEANARQLAEEQLQLQQEELLRLTSTNEALMVVLVFAIVVGGIALISSNS